MFDSWGFLEGRENAIVTAEWYSEGLACEVREGRERKKGDWERRFGIAIAWGKGHAGGAVIVDWGGKGETMRNEVRVGKDEEKAG